jgi:hypothetical protein
VNQSRRRQCSRKLLQQATPEQERYEISFTLLEGNPAMIESMDFAKMIGKVLLE